jgi:hypothetical protein
VPAAISFFLSVIIAFLMLVDGYLLRQERGLSSYMEVILMFLNTRRADIKPLLRKERKMV